MTMNHGWRWEATAGCVCNVLFVWWVWVTDRNPEPFWAAVLCLILITGIVLGLLGVRRGNLFSRSTSIFTFLFHSSVIGLIIWIVLKFR
jgi:hypothetical protein